jgi:hypothetical protein
MLDKIIATGLGVLLFFSFVSLQNGCVKPNQAQTVTITVQSSPEVEGK